ncbi:DPOE2 polymerase, partial [Geococcyx californianus]|nr:DPOE2 polymerase [Geococcyx californianus]
ENVFNIIGAFDIPRYIYNSERKKFLPLAMTNLPAPNLFGTARDKAELFRERYSILQQRTHRHELFTPSAVVVHPDESGSKFQLKTIETLLGNTAKVGEVIVLGMITQLKEGKFFLEDPTGVVQLDLSKAISFFGDFHSGLYTESCFVLAEGWYEDEVFHVNAFGFPPTEPGATTRAFYGNVNFFGGPSSTSVKASVKLKQLEDENEDAMFVFLSDVWLDQAEVLEKLHTMFSEIHLSCLYCLTRCYSMDFFLPTLGSLKALADIICEYPSIHKSSRFVFVPGPEDPGPGSVLPRPPLAENITQEFRQLVPFSVFTTNPCRIQYCTQEIIIFREDLVNKMCRNCVRFPSSNMDIPNHVSVALTTSHHL